MQLRTLGRSDLQVSPLAFGGNVFGWTADEAMSFRLLDAWVDAGFNFVDTADVYSRWVPGHSGGESETLIGKWLRQTGKRNRVVLATKLGKPMGEGKQGLSPAYIREAVDASLRRLQCDHIDLYQSHDDDPDTPLADTAAAFAELIKAGKVRAIGASNFTAPRLAEALDVAEKAGLPRYESLQPLYNLYDRAVFEKELEPLCLARGVGVINFYALAAGFLTGKYLQGMPEGSRLGLEGFEWLRDRWLQDEKIAKLKKLNELAVELGVSLGNLSIAWTLANPNTTTAILGATRKEQLADNLKALDVLPFLTPQVLARIDEIMGNKPFFNLA